LFCCLAFTMLYAKFGGRSAVELFGNTADRWFVAVLRQGSDQPAAPAETRDTAGRRRIPIRLIIWVLVVLVTIALLAPLGFRLDR
jgi:hypothetical protein